MRKMKISLKSIIDTDKDYYIKNDKPQVNPIEEFYENQPLPDFYETGYEDEGEEIVEDKKEEIQEKNSNNEDKDIFDLPKLEEKKDENITEEKPSSLRDLKKLEKCM